MNDIGIRLGWKPYYFWCEASFDEVFEKAYVKEIIYKTSFRSSDARSPVDHQEGGENRALAGKIFMKELYLIHILYDNIPAFWKKLLGRTVWEWLAIWKIAGKDWDHGKECWKEYEVHQEFDYQPLAKRWCWIPHGFLGLSG